MAFPGAAMSIGVEVTRGSRLDRTRVVALVGDADQVSCAA